MQRKNDPHDGQGAGQADVHAPTLRLVPDSEATQLLHLQPGTLAAWRSRGIGPPFHRLGRRVLYSMEDLSAFVAGGRVETSGAA